MAEIDTLTLGAVVIGIFATALLDLWSLAREALNGIAPPNYALVGRWFAHMTRGRFRHDSIAKAAPMRAEAWIGWVMHYLIGVVFAFVLLWFVGIDWLRMPTLLPAMIVGIGSVVAPFLILQPGMGLGVAASRSPRPWVARVRSLTNHAIFGVALYVAGLVYSTLM